MVMPIRPTVSGRIVAIQFRRSWNGKMVLQVQRELKRPRFMALENPVIWEAAGVGPWRDADANELDEVLEVHKFLLAAGSAFSVVGPQKDGGIMPPPKNP